MNHFFAYISRMKLIERWSLMQNFRKENVQEHSLQVAVVAHALALIGNKYFNKKYDAAQVALVALFHDASEVFTGDMPTPAKYFSKEIKQAYNKMEEQAVGKLLSYLPEDLRGEYEPLLRYEEKCDVETVKLLKGADSLCAYLKCLEELAAGNREFNRAKLSIESKLKELNMPEVEHFLKTFTPSFSLTLDELSV